MYQRGIIGNSYRDVKALKNSRRKLTPLVEYTRECPISLMS
jgi:hypothetical protein